MGKVIEKEKKVFVFTLADFVDELLGGVDPGVAVADVSSVSLDQDDPGTFIEVVLNEETIGQEKTTRTFSITRNDVVEDLISSIDGDVVSDDIAAITISGTDVEIEITFREVAQF